MSSRVDEKRDRSCGERRRRALGRAGGHPDPDGETEISYVRFAPQAPYDDSLVFIQARGSRDGGRVPAAAAAAHRAGQPASSPVHQPRPVEGKTTLAANLAMAYAELGKHRVLLLEANLRVAALGEIFGFLPPKGFATQLAVHRTRPQEPWVVVQIGGAPLYVLAAEPRACPAARGSWPRTPASAPCVGRRSR